MSEVHRIGKVGGDRASILIKQKGGKCYWSVGLKNTACDWEEIPRRLFQVLATFEPGREDD